MDGGGEDFTSRVQQIQHLRAHNIVWLNFVCQMKIHIIFVLNFSYSLSFLFVLPPPSVDFFRFEISHNINKLFHPPCPLFPFF